MSVVQIRLHLTAPREFPVDKDRRSEEEKREVTGLEGLLYGGRGDLREERSTTRIRKDGGPKVVRVEQMSTESR